MAWDVPIYLSCSRACRVWPRHGRMPCDTACGAHVHSPVPDTVHCMAIEEAFTFCIVPVGHPLTGSRGKWRPYWRCRKLSPGRLSGQPGPCLHSGTPRSSVAPHRYPSQSPVSNRALCFCNMRSRNVCHPSSGALRQCWSGVSVLQNADHSHAIVFTTLP